MGLMLTTYLTQPGAGKTSYKALLSTLHYASLLLYQVCPHYAGMGQYRAASLVLEDGCKMDPLHGQMRLHLETATQGIFRDLLEGALLPSITSELPQPSFLVAVILGQTLPGQCVA